jgi:tRNA A-37 threonylcarbamoyl transferase component Bud32
LADSEASLVIDAASRERSFEGFSFEDFHGEVAADHRPADLRAAIEQLVDPGKGGDTLHWGRNYLYTAELQAPSGPVPVVVKQFRNQGARARLSRSLKGSKATRSWKAAQAVVDAGVPTPTPLVLIESETPDGPSFFVSEKIPNFVEARYFFRALLEGRQRDAFPQVEADILIGSVGQMLRRLHDAGIWHRDVSVGNLLIVPGSTPSSPPVVYLIDLNRAQLDRPLTVSRRTRDLCRLRIFDSHLREVLLRSYWGKEDADSSFKRGLYRIYFHGFLTKNWLKDAVRSPFRWLKSVFVSRGHHAHIPPPPEGASSRDQVVWDPLSDQPHQHAGRWQRLGVRLGDAGHHARETGAALASLPRARHRYLELKKGLYRAPVRWEGLGVGMRPMSEHSGAALVALEALGVQRVLLRLHPWAENHDAEERLARELHGRGIDLAFALPQNRALVRDRGRWQAAVSQLAERFTPFGSDFQIGQAINRSKWGVWNYAEYLGLVADASRILRRYESVRILGPAVIDYEFHRLAGVLNVPWEGVHFDVVSSLLYVDRRGAPENRQLGFDTVDKAVQLKALAETGRSSGESVWVTEFNWPLWEGPHSPAGRDVSVDEESQANYLVRYCLLVLGTGLVERAYWWQLVAKGYGLAFLDAEGSFQMRPSFHALATLQEQLAGSSFLGPLETEPPVRLYRFQLDSGSEVIVGWSTAGAFEATLPRPAARVVGRDGEQLAGTVNPTVEVGPAPFYFWLEAEG